MRDWIGSLFDSLVDAADAVQIDFNVDYGMMWMTD